MPTGSKLLDTNILVYALLDEHPASGVCRAFIQAAPEWLTSPVTLLEAFYVLTSLYGVPAPQVLEKLDQVRRSPLRFFPLETDLCVAVLPLMVTHGLEANDALLLAYARKTGISQLASDDRKLQRVAKVFGLTVEHPISPQIRRHMTAWEEAHLPSKGIVRLNRRIYNWLKARHKSLAAQYKDATGNLTRLPT